MKAWHALLLALSLHAVDAENLTLEHRAALQEIRSGLAVHSDADTPETRAHSAKLKELVEAHQPESGDHLLSIISNPADKLNKAAVLLFVKSWESMSAQQIESYCQSALVLKVEARKRYPQGVDAWIGMSYGSMYDFSSWPWHGETYESPLFRTHGTCFLDGDQNGKPYNFYGPQAGVGGIRLKDLALGKHTCSMVLDYDFMHHGKMLKGSMRSRDSEFEIISSSAPNELIAPKDPKVKKLVEESFEFEETIPTPVFNGPLYFSGTNAPVAVKFPDRWDPQMTWKSSSGKQRGVHLPCWKVAQKLPVDLCFKVTILDTKTQERFPCTSIILRKGDVHEYCFLVDDGESFTRGRSGFISIQVILTPSRELALTSLRVSRYYPETITSPVMNAKVVEGD